MLVLTRRIGEKLVIDDDVTIAILNVKGNQVRIGITAPPEVQVHREEIYQRIVKERLNGAGHVNELRSKGATAGEVREACSRSS